ncbi:MAG: ABC transporter ATP-binding protein [Micavibrio sp.]|nr:ABC transporter ATP-binding protein [Micavibrio sp.]
MTDYAIEISDLNKTYKASNKQPAKVALSGVDLKIRKGSIFGLLGPNGAGKSTIINIMAGLVTKSSGSVKIWDYDIDQNLRMAKSSIGIVPQEVNNDAFFTPAKTLELMAGFYGVPKAERRTMEILKLTGLEEKAYVYARTLSGGMQRRMMIAKAMVHSPPILVLDEPTAGVDIELRRQLWANVRTLNEQGVTVLLTTHYLEEAQEMCDEIAIINHGKVVACESKETLLERVENKEIRFRLNVEALAIVPKELEKYGAQKVGQRSVLMRYSPKDTQVEEMIAAIHSAGFQILDITTDESDLEDVFLQIVQQNKAA